MKALKITLKCEGWKFSLRDSASFLWDVNTIYEKILLLGEDRKRFFEIVKNPWFYTRKRPKPEAKIQVLSLKGGSVDVVFYIFLTPILVAVVSQTPKIIEAVTKLLTTLRDWDVDHRIKELRATRLEEEIRKMKFLDEKQVGEIAYYFAPDIRKLLGSPIKIAEAKIEEEDVN